MSRRELQSPRAVGDAAAELHRLDADPRRIPDGQLLVGAPAVTPPPSATELWRSLRPTQSPHTAAGPVTAGAATAAASRPPATDPATGAQRVAGSGGAPGGDPPVKGSAAVYDLFWQEAPDQRLRDRVRRRAPGEDA